MVAFTDGRIDEASSAAMSKRNAGVFYTCNDENTAPQVFGVQTSTGDTVSTITWASASGIVDPEALQVDNQKRLWYWDIGDNDGSRSNVSVYMAAEPGLGDHTNVAATRFKLKYPDSPRNAECGLIHPVTNKRYIVSKKSTGRLYELPAALQTGNAKNLLTKHGFSLPSLVSDGCFTIDGRYVLFRREGHNTTVFVHDPARSWAKVDEITVPSQTKPEGITMALDGQSFWITSEGAAAPFYNVALPSKFWPWQASGGTSAPLPGPTPSNPCG